MALGEMILAASTQYITPGEEGQPVFLLIQSYFWVILSKKEGRRKFIYFTSNRLFSVRIAEMSSRRYP